jgi:hypothetical protein
MLYYHKAAPFLRGIIRTERLNKIEIKLYKSIDKLKQGLDELKKKKIVKKKKKKKRQSMKLKLNLLS